MQPIVLAHGLLGYRKFLLWEMFAGVKRQLEDAGLTVLQPRVHPTCGIAHRSEELERAITEKFGSGTAVHIVGHSMGGLDARYLASAAGLNAGKRILSITTLCTPHRGSPTTRSMPKFVWRILTNAGKTLRPLPFGEDFKPYLGDLGSDRWSALEELSPRFLNQEFNPQIVDNPSTRYFSYGADMNLSSTGFTKRAREILARKLEMPNEPHDGFVTVESSRWGEFKGIEPADHGSIMGLTVIPGTRRSYDHLELFRRITADLGRLER